MNAALMRAGQDKVERSILAGKGLEPQEYIESLDKELRADVFGYWDMLNSAATLKLQNYQTSLKELLPIYTMKYPPFDGEKAEERYRKAMGDHDTVKAKISTLLTQILGPSVNNNDFRTLLQNDKFHDLKEAANKAISPPSLATRGGINAMIREVRYKPNMNMIQFLDEMELLYEISASLGNMDTDQDRLREISRSIKGKGKLPIQLHTPAMRDLDWCDKSSFDLEATTNYLRTQ
jgi:hypothetical protein